MPRHARAPISLLLLAPQFSAGLLHRLPSWPVSSGARVRWTDLRMSLHEYAESQPASGGIVISNWEI